MRRHKTATLATLGRKVSRDTFTLANLATLTKRVRLAGRENWSARRARAIAYKAIWRMHRHKLAPNIPAHDSLLDDVCNEAYIIWRMQQPRSAFEYSPIASCIYKAKRKVYRALLVVRCKDALAFDIAEYDKLEAKLDTYAARTIELPHNVRQAQTLQTIALLIARKTSRADVARMMNCGRAKITRYTKLLADILTRQENQERAMENTRQAKLVQAQRARQSAIDVARQTYKLALPHHTIRLSKLPSKREIHHTTSKLSKRVARLGKARQALLVAMCEARYGKLCYDARPEQMPVVQAQKAYEYLATQSLRGKYGSYRELVCGIL